MMFGSTFSWGSVLHFDWPSDGSCHSPGTFQLSIKLGEPLAGTMYSLQFPAYIAQCTVDSVQCTVPVFVLSVSTRPSVTRGTELSRITASRQLLLGEHTTH